MTAHLLWLESIALLWQADVAMSLVELKDSVPLPANERHELVIWINRLEGNYGDVPGEALDQLAAEIWDQDDRHAPSHAFSAVSFGWLIWAISAKYGRSSL